jgi:hypothetical protein
MAQRVNKSSTKFVLVAMASCVNAKEAEMLCFATVQTLADLTAQDRKTVMDNIQRLRESSFIEDTGVRRGVTGQVPVYRLKTPEIGTVRNAPNETEAAGNTGSNSTENGTGPENGTVPVFPINSTVFPYQQYRIPALTVPKTGHRTSKEQVMNKEGTSKKIVAVAPSIPGVSDELLADYMSVRKAKKAGALTATAIAGLEREATKAGLTLSEAVTVCCERGWQGFNAGWYVEQPKASAGKPATSGKHTGFQNLNYRDGVTEDGSFA